MAIVTGIVTALVAGLMALAQQAGQSIQQLINSPQAQQQLQNIVRQFGPDVLREVLEKLGIN